MRHFITHAKPLTISAPAPGIDPRKSALNKHHLQFRTSLESPLEDEAREKLTMNKTKSMVTLLIERWPTGSARLTVEAT